MNAMLLSAALAVGAPALKDRPKVVPPIVGVWVVESTTGGVKDPARVPTGLRYEFTADGQWLMSSDRDRSKPVRKEYTVDPRASPPTIDARTAGGGGPAMTGIYRLDGDTLTLCFGPNNGERPKVFEAQDGERRKLIVLKRVKKE